MTINSDKKSKRLNDPSGNKWADIVGYSRAEKVENTIEVTGTISVDENGKIYSQKLMRPELLVEIEVTALIF